MDPPIYLRSKKNGKILYCNGYLYRIKQRILKKSMSYWRCTNSDCKATVKLNMEGNEVLSTFGNHCHAPDPTEVIVRKFYENIKNKILQEPNLPLKEIYQKGLSEIPATVEVLARIPDFNGMRHFMYNVRATVKPPLPRNADKGHLDGVRKRKLLDGRTFPMANVGSGVDRIHDDTDATVKNDDELEPVDTKESEDSSITSVISSVSSASTSQSGFKSSKTAKRKRKTSSDTMVDIDENEYLKHIFADDNSVFGAYVARKMRKYSDCTKSTVEHLISNILFEADMGNYDYPQAVSTSFYANTSSQRQMNNSQAKLHRQNVFP